MMLADNVDLVVAENHQCASLGCHPTSRCRDPPISGDVLHSLGPKDCNRIVAGDYLVNRKLNRLERGPDMLHVVLHYVVTALECVLRSTR